MRVIALSTNSACMLVQSESLKESSVMPAVAGSMKADELRKRNRSMKLRSLVTVSLIWRPSARSPWISGMAMTVFLVLAEPTGM